MSTIPGTSPAVPYPTIDDLLVLGRNLLLDPATAPQAPNPLRTDGISTLQDVRIRGKPDPVGTVGWTPGSTGYPFGVLTTGRVRKNYHEQRRSISDWQASLQIALTAEYNNADDFDGWANLWEAVMNQWFPLHRGFGLVADPPGDHYWQYEPQAEKRVYHAGSGVAVFGVIFEIRVHSVDPITWGA